MFVKNFVLIINGYKINFYKCLFNKTFYCFFYDYSNDSFCDSCYNSLPVFSTGYFHIYPKNKKYTHQKKYYSFILVIGRCFYSFFNILDYNNQNIRMAGFRQISKLFLHIGRFFFNLFSKVRFCTICFFK